MADEALQTSWGDARSAPQLHQSNWGEKAARARWRLRGRRKLDGGCSTDTSRRTVAVWAQEAGAIGGGCFKTQRQGSEIRNLGGEPHGFIGTMDARRATVLLDLQACHAHRRVTSRDTRPQSLSLPIENHGGRFAFQANPDSLPA